MATRLMRLIVCAALVLNTVSVAAAQEEEILDEGATTEEIFEPAPEASEPTPEMPPAEAPAQPAAQPAPPAAPAATVSVTFSKPLITPYPSFSSAGMTTAFAGASDRPAAQLPSASYLFSGAAQADPCRPDPNTGTPTTPTEPSGPVVLPKAMMMVVLTNNSNQVQSYMLKATKRANGAELGVGAALFVPGGKSTIPMFVLMNEVPTPDEVAFSAELFEIPANPCFDFSAMSGNISFGQASLQNTSVRLPVTNQDSTPYQLSLQAGLMQGEYLVAVAMGSGRVAGGGNTTANLSLTFPFGISAAPNHTSIIPALAPMGIQRG